jgi:hypothetical protein
VAPVISRVPGPLHIEVACTRPCGQQYILALDNAMARLAAHEIDHLAGWLCTSRMRDGASPIPVSDYRGTGHSCAYPVTGQASANLTLLSHRVIDIPEICSSPAVTASFSSWLRSMRITAAGD